MKKIIAILLFSPFLVYGQFVEKQKITASDRYGFDFYGKSIDIDGDRIIVGAHREGDTPTSDILSWAGAAYILQKNAAGVWEEQQKIFPTHRRKLTFFGTSVAIEGDFAVVGAPKEDYDANNENEVGNAGAVYIYKKQSSGTWQQIQKIVASDRASGDQFGNKVVIDNNFIYVGINSFSLIGSGANSDGAVYVFEKSATEDTWSEVQKIKAADAKAKAFFGRSISIDNQTLAVGADGESTDAEQNNSINAAGAVYVFKKNAAGLWEQKQKIVPSYRLAWGSFGSSTSIKGNIMVAGTVGDDQNVSGTQQFVSAGAAYVFKKNAAGVWEEQQKILSPDRSEYDYFGTSLALLSDSYLVVGATGEGEGLNGSSTLSGAGAAYLFKSNASGQWSSNQKIVPNNRHEDVGFGSAVAVSDNQLCFGVESESYDASESNMMKNAGATYVFEGNSILGVSELQLNTHILVYPNPTSDYIFIKSKQPIKESSLYDFTGKKVKEFTTINQKIFVGDLPQGVYFLKFKNYNISKKIIVK